MDKTPIYKFPADYAREHDELDAYRASRAANIACKKAIETAINNNYDGLHMNTDAAVGTVVKQFGYDRMLYVLSATVRHKDWDGRISPKNKEWAQTVPVIENTDSFGNDRNTEFVVDQAHPVLINAFVTEARHEHLLSLPLKREDIKTEALKILSQFQEAREPNSPNKTHFMAQVSPDFMKRAKTKDTDRLFAMLPFKSLSISTLEGRRGTFALISKDEDRFQKLQLRKPSVRKKLEEAPAPPKTPVKGKAKEQER